MLELASLSSVSSWWQGLVSLELLESLLMSSLSSRRCRTEVSLTASPLLLLLLLPAVVVASPSSSLCHSAW